MSKIEFGRRRVGNFFFRISTILSILALFSCYKPQPLSLPSPDIASYKDIGSPDDSSSQPEVSKLTIKSEDDAVKQALENNGKLKILRQDVDIASYKLKSAGKVDNPELRVGDLTTRDIDEGRLREIEVGLRWQNPKIGELAADKDVAKAEAGLTDVKQGLYIQELCADVRKLYVEIVALNKLIDIYDRRIELESSKVSILESQIALGERTSLDLTKARLDLFKAKEERSQLIYELKTKKTELEFLIGVPSDIQAGEIEEKPIEKTAEQLIAVAYKNRPEFQGIYYEHQLAQANYHLEKAKVFPWFSFVEISYHGEDDPNDPPEHWGELRFGFDLPIFNLNNGNIRAERVTMERCSNRLEVTKREIEKQVVDAYNIYKDLLTELNAYEKEASALIADAQRVLNDAQNSRVVDPLKIVEIQLKTLDIQESLVDKKRRLALARIGLLSACGIVQSGEIK